MRKIFPILILLLSLTASSCAYKPKLPDDAGKLEWDIYTDDTGTEYLAIRIDDDLYYKYGRTKRKVHKKDVGECLGYMDEEKKDIVFRSADHPTFIIIINEDFPDIPATVYKLPGSDDDGEFTPEIN